MHARCFAGHAYGINGSTDSKSQQQSQQPDQIGPNISLLPEELQGQWHEQLKRHLGSIVIKPYSNRKVRWSCDQCPDSLPHVWEATVSDRSKGKGCPYCSGREVCQHNTLARKAPQVAQLWNAKKNSPLSPDQVTVSSGIRAHWKCSDCLHEWQAPVVLKACNNSGCPKCAKVNGNMRADSTRQKQPTFAEAKHALLEQWNFDRNIANRHFPGDITLGSNKLIWWQCHACPRARSTAGKLPHTIKLLKLQQGVLSVQAVCFVNATLCKLFVLMLLLILMSKRMVSVLLKSQVQPLSVSIAGY